MTEAKKRQTTKKPTTPKATGKGGASAKKASGRKRSLTHKSAQDAETKPNYPLALIPQPPPTPEPTRLELFHAWADRLDGAAMSELCEHIVEGGHLFGFCKSKDFAYTTVRGWLAADPERTAMYARAREDRADVFADETKSISDEPCTTPIIINGAIVGEMVDSAAVQRNKLRVDARKWLAAKMKPRDYGDKLDVSGKVEHEHRNVSDEALIRQAKALGIELPPLGKPESGIAGVFDMGDVVKVH